MSRLTPQLTRRIYTSGTSGLGPFDFGGDRNRVAGLFDAPENPPSFTGVEIEWPRHANRVAELIESWGTESVRVEDSTIAEKGEPFELLSTSLSSLLVWLSDHGDTRGRHWASGISATTSPDTFVPETSDTALSTREASRCIERLVAGDDAHSDAWRTLTSNTTPQTVARAGLELFKRKGNEERLLTTARVLAAHGASAFEALADLAGSGIAEADYFIEPLFTLLTIDESRVLGIVDSLFRNPHPWVRRAAFEVLDDAESATRRRVLSHLAKHDLAEVAATAVKRLQQQ